MRVIYEATYGLFSSHPLLHLFMSLALLCSTGDALWGWTSLCSGVLSSSGLFNRLSSETFFGVLRSSLTFAWLSPSLCLLNCLAFPDFGGGVMLLALLFGDRLSFRLGECWDGERDLDRDLFLMFVLLTLMSCFWKVSNRSCLLRDPFASLPLELLDLGGSGPLPTSSRSFRSVLLFFSLTSSSFRSVFSCICFRNLGSFLLASNVFGCSGSESLLLWRAPLLNGDTVLDFNFSSVAEVSFFGILISLGGLSGGTWTLFSGALTTGGVTWLSFLNPPCSFKFTDEPEARFNLGSLFGGLSACGGCHDLCCVEAGWLTAGGSNWAGPLWGGWFVLAALRRKKNNVEIYIYWHFSSIHDVFQSTDMKIPWFYTRLTSCAFVCSSSSSIFFCWSSNNCFCLASNCCLIICSSSKFFSLTGGWGATSSVYTKRDIMVNYFPFLQRKFKNQVTVYSFHMLTAFKNLGLTWMLAFTFGGKGLMGQAGSTEFTRTSKAYSFFKGKISSQVERNLKRHFLVFSST